MERNKGMLGAIEHLVIKVLFGTRIASSRSSGYGLKSEWTRDYYGCLMGKNEGMVMCGNYRS